MLCVLYNRTQLERKLQFLCNTISKFHLFRSSSWYS